MSPCCNEFLLPLQRNAPVPPVRCPNCGREITYDRVPIEESRSVGEETPSTFTQTGFIIENPKYTEE